MCVVLGVGGLRFFLPLIVSRSERNAPSTGNHKIEVLLSSASSQVSKQGRTFPECSHVVPFEEGGDKQTGRNRRRETTSARDMQRHGKAERYPGRRKCMQRDGKSEIERERERARQTLTEREINKDRKKERTNYR